MGAAAAFQWFFALQCGKQLWKLFLWGDSAAEHFPLRKKQEEETENAWEFLWFLFTMAWRYCCRHCGHCRMEEESIESKIEEICLSANSKQPSASSALCYYVVWRSRTRQRWSRQKNDADVLLRTGTAQQPAMAAAFRSLGRAACRITA